MVIRSHTFRRALALVAAFTLVALWLPKLLPGASAIGGFEDNDGNLHATSGANDWDGIPAAELGKHFFTATDRPSGTTDDDMGGGSKNSDTTVHLTQGTIPDNKADLKRGYLYAQGQFLHLAWIRAQSTGDVHIDFEINQDQQSWPSATKAFQDARVVREPKDVLISYDWPGSGLPDITARQWTGSAWGPAQDWSAPPSKAEAFVNAAAVTDIDGTTSIPAEDFGEVGIDLLAAGIYTPGQCTDFSSVTVKSRSAGSGFDSELKDYIAPKPVSISNCATIITKKVTHPTGSTQQFNFAVTGGPVGNTQNDTFHLTDGQQHSTTSVRPSDSSHTYTDTETGVSGWAATSGSCDNGSGTFSGGAISGITAGAGDVVTCTFTNTQQAKLVVAKTTAPTSATDKFSFTGSTGVGTITDLGNADTWTSDFLAPGNYTVQESTKTGWDLTHLSCSGDSGNTNTSSGSVADRTATYRLDPGETVTCTFTNTERGTIKVEKVTDPAGGTGFTFTGDAAGTIDDGQFITVNNLVPGTYTSTESDPTGYSLADIVCDDSNSSGDLATRTATFHLDPGETVTCVFTNSQLATIRVNKTTVPASDTTTSFPFTLNGPNSLSEPFSLTNGHHFTDATLGAGTYSVAEGTLPADWTNTSASCSKAGSAGTFAPSSITLASGDVVTCDFTNTHYVSLTVNKTISANGDTVPAGGFVVNVSCSDGTTAQLTFHADGSQSVAGIVDGSTCTATEPAVAGWTASPSASQQVTLDSDGGSVSFTNSRDTGVITVSKNIVGDPVGVGRVFTFHVDCPGDADDSRLTIDLSNATSGSTSTGQIPTGVVCTVSEDSAPGWSTTVSPGNGQVTVPGSVDFTNTRQTGVITIDKSLVGDPTGATRTFTFHVDCDGTGYDQDVPLDLSSDTSGSATTGQIPTGTSCTVSEGDHTGWTVTVDPESGTATVPGTVTFTNTRDTDVITVTKATVGAVAGASTVFTFDIVCAANPAYDQQLTIDTSQTDTATSTPIPTGLACSVNEESTSGWQQTTPAQGGVDVTVPGTAAFTNTRLTGPLQLSKSVTPTTGSFTPGDPNNTLTYKLSLSPTGALDHTDVVMTDYIPGYDPADTTSGKTTYVDGSATCSTGCPVTYDASQHLLTWDVGNVAHDATPVVFTFKVTIDEPAFNATVGLAPETIDNVGYVQSLQQSKTPSNQVKVPVTAVLGVKVVRKQPKLPFTGLPAQQAVTVALSMLGAGILLTRTRRRQR